MDQIAKAANSAASDAPLSFERTQEVLREALRVDTDPAELEFFALDREAAAAFIADHASLLRAVSHAAGLSTVKIICDLLYVNAFGDAASPDLS